MKYFIIKKNGKTVECKTANVQCVWDSNSIPCINKLNTDKGTIRFCDIEKIIYDIKPRKKETQDQYKKRLYNKTIELKQRVWTIPLTKNYYRL